MATERRMSWELKKLWPAGEYTLLADSHTTENGLPYSKGETLSLSQWEATKLGNDGAVAAPASMRAVRARVEAARGTLRDEYLCQMWDLSGAWEEARGKP